MKKIYFVLLLAVVMISTGCEKSVLKRTTLAVDISTATVELNPNEYGKYLNEWVGTEEQLLSDYKVILEERLGKRKIDMVSMDSNPDYVLRLESIMFQERMNHRRKGGIDFEISTIGCSANFELTHMVEDVPTYFNVWLETSDCIQQTECETSYELDPTSISELDKCHGADVRRMVKSKMKDNQ